MVQEGFEDRRRRGRSLRKAVPRGAMAEGGAPPGRDPIAVLEQQAATRAPELVPIRHGRMAESPFAFFRGGAAIMAADLADTPMGALRG